MKKASKKQLHQLQAHVDRNYKRWFARYTNIYGIEVTMKQVAGKPVDDCLSFVFHVTAKSDNITKKIPPYLPVIDEKGKRINVPTDVIEAGALTLQGIKLGDTAKNSRVSLAGTISYYFRNPRGVFLCSNMHVLAPHLLNRGIISYDRRRGHPPEEIVISNNAISATADLLRGQFNGLDIAFARIDNPLVPEVIEPLIRSVGEVKGVLDLDDSNVSTARLSFCGRTSGLRQCRVRSLRAKKATEFQNVFLTNLIKLERCTVDGDSGAPVFDQRSRIVGVVIGRDNDYSYAMPINDIIQFYQDSNF